MPVLESWADLIIATAHSPFGDAVEARMEQFRFSPREREIARLILAGVTNNQTIAERLYISPSTVKNLLHSAYDRCGVNDRSQLILRLLGLI